MIPFCRRLDEGERVSFDWSSTLPIDAVIVKAGNAANVFKYVPPVSDDTGLYGPDEKGISHVTFCWNAPGFEIPEVPYGTIVTLLSMLTAMALFQKKPIQF